MVTIDTSLKSTVVLLGTGATILSIAATYWAASHVFKFPDDKPANTDNDITAR